MCVVIPTKTSRIRYVQYAELDDCSLIFAESFTYLGDIITEDGRDDDDELNKQFRKAKSHRLYLKIFFICENDIKFDLFAAIVTLFSNVLWALWRSIQEEMTLLGDN